MRWPAACAVVGLVGVCAGGASADAPLVHALTQATVGGTVSESAQRVDPGPYTLSLTDPTPEQGTICSAKLAGPVRASKGSIKMSGKVPSTLSCYTSDGTLVTRAKVAAGTYMLVMCQAGGPTSCDGSHSVIQHQVNMHVPPSHPKTKSR